MPSSRYNDPDVLRDALIEAVMKHKSPRLRSVMIAITMIGGINCGIDDADAVVHFLRPFQQHGIRVNVDLIPYNDIGIEGLQRPSDVEIQVFKVMMMVVVVIMMMMMEVLQTNGDEVADEGYGDNYCHNLIDDVDKNGEYGDSDDNVVCYYDDVCL